MAKTVNSNYTSSTSPGNAFNSRISADADAFDRNDIDALGSALEQHTHASGLGLAVARLATSVTLTGTTTFTGAGVVVNSGGLTVTAGGLAVGTTLATGVTTAIIQGATQDNTQNALNVTNSGSTSMLRVRNDNSVWIAGTAGTCGWFGSTPVGRQSLGAAATDAATTQTLANNIRTALINFNLATT